MSALAKDAALAALQLIGHVNALGFLDENREAKYLGLAPAYLSILCSEIGAAEGAAGGAATVAGLDATLPVSDDSAQRVLPAGLAMYFSVADRETELYNYFSSLYYGTLLPGVRAPEAAITDYYGVLRDGSFSG
ncbi:MAG: hypothetical protein P4L75_04665 [Clostridia bacterium]|nr:hypothetical protein [Clostridia bacterium]